MDLTALAFFAAGLTIFLGFIGEEFFKKTGIPDAVFLLIFGLLLGPIFHIFSRDSLMPIAPYFATLALIIILFDGGLNLDLRKVITESPRASILGLTGFLLSSISVALICKCLLGWRYLNGFLLGTIIGGSSSIIVIAIVRKIGVSEEMQTILSLESALTDVLCTVGAFAVINVILSGQVNLEAALRSVAAAFAVGGILGFFFGGVWLYALQKLHKSPNAYMLTLAMLLVVFVIATALGGTGAVSALFLGLAMGNGPYISKMLELERTIAIDEKMKTFHSEISFLIRTFFFVFTGLLVSLTSMNYILLGIGLSILLLGLRFIAVKVSMVHIPGIKKYELKKGDETVMTILLPRGLAAAVLASLPLSYGIAGADVFPEIVFTVIITTIIICTAGIAASPEAHLPTSFNHVKKLIKHKIGKPQEEKKQLKS